MATNISKIDGLKIGDHVFISSEENEDPRLVSVSDLISFLNDNITLDQAANIAGINSKLGQSTWQTQATKALLNLNTTDDVFFANLELGADGVLTMDEHSSAPATPTAGKIVIYPKADGKLYQKDDTGTETDLTSGFGGGGDATSIQGVNIDSSAGTPSEGSILVYRSAGSDWVLEAKPAAGANPAWGDITGALASQTDLQAALDGKATSAQGAVADTATQPGDNVSTLTNDAGYAADQTDAEIETAYNNQVAKVSAGEIAAGTEAAVRRLSPADVKAFVDTYGGSMTDAQIETAYNNQVPQVTIQEINAGTETAVRRLSPDNVKDFVSATAVRPGDNTNLGQLEITGSLYVNQVANFGNSGASIELNFSALNFARLTLTDNCTITIVPPLGPAKLTLELIQGGVGGWTPTFPASVVFTENNTVPTWSTSVGATDVLSLYYNGANYRALSFFKEDA